MQIGTNLDGLKFLDRFMNRVHQRGADQSQRLKQPKGLGQIAPSADVVNLSSPVEGEMRSFRAAFEMNFSAIREIHSERGDFKKELSFSFSASVEFLHSSTGGVPEELEISQDDPMAFLKDFFSPEKTATRILDFALGGFANSEAFAELGSTEQTRGDFADLIAEAIQQGVDEARKMLGGVFGELPEETEAGIARTEDLVRDGLEQFTAGTYPSPSEQVAQRIEAFRLELSVQVRSSTSINYNAAGVALPSQAQAGAFSVVS